jgi:formylglycine-generating enzyme required for sulfatase activity
MKTAPFTVPACLLMLALGGWFVTTGADRLPAARAQKKVKVITNSIGMKLARIPAGKFTMGSPASEAERESDESAHEVTISKPFYLGVFEVTQGQYQKVMGKNPSFFSAPNGGGPDHPVDQVIYKEAVAFCSKLSGLAKEEEAGRVYRLPTEAEWEYACRAGTKTVFNVGDSLSSKQANFNGNEPYGGAAKGPYLGKPAKVGSYPPNAWGLYEMHGNVWEWCADYYDANYYARSPTKDPKGPAKGVLPTDYGNFYRVVRGGCWLDEGRGCRAAYRFRFMPKERYRLVGFRVACDVTGK